MRNFVSLPPPGGWHTAFWSLNLFARRAITLPAHSLLPMNIFFLYPFLYSNSHPPPPFVPINANFFFPPPMLEVPADRTYCLSIRGRLFQTAARPWIRNWKVPLHLYITTTRRIRRNGGLAPHIRNLCTRWWVMGLTFRRHFLWGIFSANWNSVWGKMGTYCLLRNKTRIPLPSTVRSSQNTDMSRFHIGQVLSSNLVRANNPVIWFSFPWCSSGRSREIKNRPRPLPYIFISNSRSLNQCKKFQVNLTINKSC